MTTKPGKLVEVDELRKYFSVGSGLLRVTNRHAVVKAVDGVSFSINEGETYALVGESGCGKTTLSRAMLRLEPPTSGRVLWQERDVWRLRGQSLREFRKDVQAVFQDPWSSMNPRMRAGSVVAEPLVVSRQAPRREVTSLVARLLDRVGIPAAFTDRFPHEFSGGQRQRLAVARALALSPRLIVLDEPVSALDVSIRAQIMNLLKDLQDQAGISYLLIAHHLATVRYLSDRVAVMYLGRIVEEAGCDELFDRPLHPYTHILLAAALPARPQERKRNDNVAVGELPSPLNVPKGCRFNPRCPLAIDVCRTQEPGLVAVRPGHRVACHRWEEVERLTQGGGLLNVSTASRPLTD